ncbi:unnamed protein product [Dibothriocephalus latus]|uniref:Uncharacterized protein n=1 Tax=Dibothriocephalus latus TaxID=60516 RepID=A0A3P6TW62_DIBLA|nr:unnamed protein product [Dibothriocephalus latus]
MADAAAGLGDMESSEPKVRTPATRLRKFITRLLLGLLLLVLLLIIILVSVYCVAPDVFNAYCIIVDAGSTSTKITLFRWRDFPFRSNGWVKQVNHTKTKKGISAYAQNPEEASASLVPVIKQLLDANVPKARRKSTRLFLGATAGMRLLKCVLPSLN